MTQSPPRLQRRSVSVGSVPHQQTHLDGGTTGGGGSGVGGNSEWDHLHLLVHRQGGVQGVQNNPASPARSGGASQSFDHDHPPAAAHHQGRPPHHNHNQNRPLHHHHHPQLSTPLAAHLTNLAHLSTVITPAVVMGGHGRGHGPNSAGVPVVSPFRMVPSPHRRVKTIFGLCLVVVICGVAPLELRSMWLKRQRNAAAMRNGAMGVVGEETDGGMNGGTAADPRQQQQQMQMQRPPRPPTSKTAAEADEDANGPRLDLSGPFALHAYRNLHPPRSPHTSLLHKLSRRLLALRLRISSRRNERATGERDRLDRESAGAAAGAAAAAANDAGEDDGGEGSSGGGGAGKKKRGRRKTRQELVRPYKILTSEEMYYRMKGMVTKYPDLVTMKNAQTEFGLATAGGVEDCAFEGRNGDDVLGERGENGPAAASAAAGCRNWYLTIEDGIYNVDRTGWQDQDAAAGQDRQFAGQDGGARLVDGEEDGQSATYPSAAAAYAPPPPPPSARLPEVFLSGALHGDERVGPTAVIETAELLLESAWCESLPRMVGPSVLRGNGTETRTRRRRRIVEGGEETDGDEDSDEEEDDGEEDSDEWHSRRQASKTRETASTTSSTTSSTADDQDEEAWGAAVLQARRCRSSLSARGVRGPHRRWLARLVSTRRIVVLPAANSLGYERNVRHEGDDASMDPNRDFPYDLAMGADGTSKMCMRTIAGRTINELFLRHMFQMGVTYHGGMEAVTYEWGAPSYQLDGGGRRNRRAVGNPTRSFAAPDATSQSQLASIYSTYGGKFTTAASASGGRLTTSPLYPVGTMNDVVYPVRGGMEDWSYAGSWDPERVSRCDPDTYGGYPPERTVYGPSELRSFTALVETSDDKTPREESLGTDEDLFTPFGAGNGHVSRNVRLALAAVDLVEPYVQILDAAGREIRDDVVPLSPRRHRSCTRTKVLTVPEGTKNVTVGWAVGGAATVDSTALMVGRWDDLDGRIFDCLKQPTKRELDDFFAAMDDDGEEGGDGRPAPVNFTDALGPGPARWNDQLGYPDPSSSSSSRSVVPEESIFRSKVDLSSFVQGDSVAVYAVARVDQGWTGQDGNVAGNVPPQTHLVNARTNPDWRHESASGKIVQGRLDWFSVPLTIEIGKPRGPTVEKSVRSPDEEWQPDRMTSGALIRSLLLGFAFAVGIAGCVLFREKSDGTDFCAVWREHRRIEAEAVPPEEYAPGSYGDRGEGGYDDEEGDLPTYDIS